MDKEIYNKAIRFLARRNYFSTELFNKLKIKFEAEPIKIVIKYLTESKFLNDELTAELYIAELQRKKYGSFYIINKLRSKGVEPEDANFFISKFYSVDIENTNLEYYKTKLLKTQDFEDKLKFHRYLKNRGF